MTTNTQPNRRATSNAVAQLPAATTPPSIIRSAHWREHIQEWEISTLEAMRLALVLRADLPLVTVKGELMDLSEALYGATVISAGRRLPTIENRLDWGVEL
jgi:hypothetical protein